MWISTLSAMRTLPLAVGKWPRWLLLVFVQGIEEVLKENMKGECFRMIVGPIGVSA
jgi:hypothetical protein